MLEQQLCSSFLILIRKLTWTMYLIILWMVLTSVLQPYLHWIPGYASLKKESDKLIKWFMLNMITSYNIVLSRFKHILGWEEGRRNHRKTGWVNASSRPSGLKNKKKKSAHLDLETGLDTTTSEIKDNAHTLRKRQVSNYPSAAMHSDDSLDRCHQSSDVPPVGHRYNLRSSSPSRQRSSSKINTDTQENHLSKSEENSLIQSKSFENKHREGMMIKDEEELLNERDVELDTLSTNHSSSLQTKDASNSEQTKNSSPCLSKSMDASTRKWMNVFIRKIHYPMRPPKKRKTLILDLDETLIHSTSKGSRMHDFVVEVMIEKHPCLYYVYKRPYANYFLKQVSEWYKVVIFTASVQNYADPVIDWLDKQQAVSKRYFRQACTPFGLGYFKDLAMVEPDLSQVCLVDNSPMSYVMHQDNGIPIEAWTEDLKDECLLDLLVLLNALRYVDDVRSILSLKS